MTLRLLTTSLLCVPTVALRAYGHAFSRPHDFSATQYEQVVARFPVFTVEKNHAAALYGNASRPAPFNSNSIASTVGTARKLKALKPSIKVLMYWNTALFFNFYECEADVDQATWLLPKGKGWSPQHYNYSVPAFRTWWVKCAVDAVVESDGALDGLFLDATPKLEAQPGATAFLGSMIDAIKAALPRGSLVMDNGFFLTGAGVIYGGESVWSHTKLGYIESLEKIGSPVLTLQHSMTYLTDISNASSAHPAPERMFIGHGNDSNETEFFYSLAKFLLVTSSVENAYFLANTDYSIDGGLLEQPTSVYGDGDGVGCGEPLTSFFTASGFVVSRAFEKGACFLYVSTVAFHANPAHKLTRSP